MAFAAVAGAAIGAAGAIGSSLMNSSGQSNALAAQQQALAQEQQYITGATNKATGYLDPYASAGTTALGQLQSGMSDGSLNGAMTNAQYQASPLYTPMINSLADLQATPGYQFQLDQGLQGVNNSAAAKGSLLSGATLKATNDYAQGQAATGYQAAWQRAQQAYQQAFSNNQSTQNQKFQQLQTVANNGQTAATNQGNYQMSGAASLAGATSNFGNNASSLALAGGQNNANALTGTTNAITSGIAQYQTAPAASTSTSNTSTPTYNSSNYQTGINNLNQIPAGTSLNSWLSSPPGF